MAKKFLVDIDLNKLELQNAVIQNLASDPSNPVAGLVYFNTTTHRFRVYTGTEWNEMGTGGGTVTSVSIENAEDGGLSISGSPITSAGTITIGHSNSITAQSTQGLYPITYDKNGHITGAGTAVGVVSSSANGLAPAINSGNTQSAAIATNDLVFDATTGKYAKLPANAFKDTTYTDGTAGYTLKAKQDGSGNVITDTYAPLTSPAFTGTPTAPTAASGTSTTQIATTEFVTSAISGITGAMVFKGTVGTGGTAGTTLPTTGVKVGDTYKVASAGTYASQSAKVGDLFIATATTPTWAYVPSGDDAAVTSITAGTGLTGGTITTTGTIALATSGVSAGTYQGITVDTYGRVTSAQNMGYTTNEGTVTSVGITQGTGITVSGSPITTSGNITVGLADVLSSAQTTSGVYPIKVNKQGQITELGSAVTILKKYTGTITGNSSTKEFTITHSLGSRDVIVQVYDGTSYEEVIVDIARTTTSAVKVTFAAAPATGTTYKVVVIG